MFTSSTLKWWEYIALICIAIVFVLAFAFGSLYLEDSDKANKQKIIDLVLTIRDQDIRAIENKNVYCFDSIWGKTGKEYRDELMAWMREYPQRTIVSITCQPEDETRLYIVYKNIPPINKIKIEICSVNKDWNTSNGQQYYSVRTLTKIVGMYKNIVCVCSVPGKVGSIESFIVICEDKP